ncbi:MAG: hypothetical protein NZ891_08260, partial [bacterium]|nr:hypothetical protein [bacterium]MDW8164713.1 hypothetical protein [Candidatus Omnitrophota bacterium]
LKKWDEEILSGIYLEMNKNIGENKIVIDWRWMENNEFFIDFFKEKYLEKSKTFNYFSLTRKLGEGIFGFSLVENAKEEILKVEKLPEIRYFIPYRNIFDTPIFFSYDFRFTNFLKEDDNYLRILNNLNFTYKKDLPYFSIRPYLSFSTLNYENSNFDKLNYIGEFGINFSTNFYKLFNDNNIFFTPSISIFKRNTKYQPNQLIQFDEFENKNEGNFLRSSFLWNIDLKNDSKGSFEIENEYSIDRNKIENIFLKYDLTIKKLKLEGDNEWGLENGENIYKFGVNTISYEDKNYKFSIGTRFEDASNILGLETWWEQSLKNDWQYRIGLFYDFKSDELIYHTYEIWKKIHCLTVSLKVSKDKENFSFYIFVTPSIFFENNWERRFKKWK